MKLFGRKQPRTAPDAYVPFLTAEQAAHVRALLHDAFAVRGADVVVAGDHVRTHQGLVLPLRPVAAACLKGEEGSWRRTVDAQVTRFVEGLERLDRDPHRQRGADLRVGVADRRGSARDEPTSYA